MPRLLRWLVWMWGASPSSVTSARAASPAGGSTLITSAPRSANSAPE